jgi:PPE-repeat protein
MDYGAPSLEINSARMYSGLSPFSASVSAF